MPLLVVGAVAAAALVVLGVPLLVSGQVPLHTHLVRGGIGIFIGLLGASGLSG